MSHKKKASSIIRLTAAALGAMAAYNISESKKAVANNIHENEHRRSYTGKYGDISYIHKGSGPLMLLIHDLTPASSSYEWNEIIDKLADDYAVYAVDLLGCADSGKNNIEYSVYMYAMAVNDFVRNRMCRSEDDHKIVALASGASSDILVCAAALDDKLYSKIGLINPPTFSQSAGEVESKCPVNGISNNPKVLKIMRHTINLPVVGTFIYNLHFNRNSIKKHVADMTGNDFGSDDTDKYTDAFYEASHLGGAGSKFLFSSMQGSLLSSDSLRMLKKLNCECFIIAGSDAPDIDSALDDYSSAGKNIIIRKIDNCCLPHLEKPSEFVNELKGCLNA